MIELYHVVKRYPGQERPALDDINLKIGKGELCLLTGPSGAGKSTLLRLLFRAEVPTRGQVLLLGKNIARLGSSQVPLLRRRIGVVFQDFKLISGRTVFENVALALEVQGRSSLEVRARVILVLRGVGLSDKTDARVEHLSGGEQQRVAIARALITDPAILLCDEPTGNLDAERAQGIVELLKSAHVRGTTVILATHDPALLEDTSHRTIALRDGKTTVTAE
jgi:cell division transport system ATP-binding protein